MSATTAGWTTAALLALVAAVLVAGWLAYARAIRVDRLHRQVLGARATLETQMALRAQAVVELAGLGLVDPASALLLTRAAHAALEATGPVVDDGLDPQAGNGRGLARASTAGAGASALPHPQRDALQPPRAVVESELSAVVRSVLDAPARAELERDPAGALAIERLDRAAYRLVLARRFHNTHVAQARALRALPSVRLLHLAGRAPMPATCDMDDDIHPEPASPVTGAEAAQHGDREETA